jgi:hypothetical protein
MQVVVAAVIAVILLVGVSIGYAAWKSSAGDHATSGTGSEPAASGATDPVVQQSTSPRANPTAADAGKPLTDLPPAAGGSQVNHPAGTSGVLEMPCATGGNGDRYRAVRYDLLGAYQRFTAHVTRAGSTRPEARAQIEVILDSTVKDRRTIRLGEEADVAASVAGGQQLELRLTCEEPAGTVTFTDARLTR